MKKIIILLAIALAGCSEPKQKIAFVAGQVLPATIIKVDSHKRFTAHFSQLNLSGDMSNFEKPDANTTNNLRENDCELITELNKANNRLVSQNITVVCGTSNYFIEGSVLDENRMTGLSEFDVNTNVYLTILKSN